jgi:hypothetical protein
MQVMMRYTFGPGGAGRLAYERFAKWVPDEGFAIKAGWVSANNDGGFLLLEADTTEALLKFSAQFKDLNESLDIVPVVDLMDGVSIAMSAYQWIDSLG